MAPAPLPSDPSLAATQARFDALQRKARPLWTSIRALNQDPQTIVVVPSVDVDVDLD